MTVQNIIDNVNQICDNRYIDSQKRTWISEVDNKITREILPIYSKSVPSFFPYTSNTDTVIGSANDISMYVDYVCYKMNLYNNEPTRANNHMFLFNTEFNEFATNYNRTHTSVHKGYKI